MKAVGNTNVALLHDCTMTPFTHLLTNLSSADALLYLVHRQSSSISSHMVFVQFFPIEREAPIQTFHAVGFTN